jgi:hypothetical protein
MVVYHDGVFIAGESSNGSDLDFVTIKYLCSDGSEDWVKRFEGLYGDDEAYAIAVANGRVFVTGESRGLIYDNIVTVKYSASGGSQYWVKSYNGGRNDYATAIVADDSGNFYITGCSQVTITQYDYLTLAYDTNGVEQWSKTYDGAAALETGDVEIAWDIALDGSRVYVTGRLHDGSGEGLAYGTVAYRTSDGYRHWVRTYDGPAGGDDRAKAVAVDDAGNVWVTGTSLNDMGWGQSCIMTIRYTPSGSALMYPKCSGMPYCEEVGRDIAISSTGNPMGVDFVFRLIG